MTDPVEIVYACPPVHQCAWTGGSCMRPGCAVGCQAKATEWHADHLARREAAERLRADQLSLRLHGYEVRERLDAQRS